MEHVTSVEKFDKANKYPNAKQDDDNGNSNGGGGKKFTRKCNFCGKTGHKADKCWDDDKNTHLNPKWWNKKGETELSATPKETGSSGQGGEFLLMVVNKMEFMALANILDDTNVFIGDTGVSSETTTSDLGFQNKKPASAAENNIDASGNDLTGKNSWGCVRSIL